MIPAVRLYMGHTAMGMQSKNTEIVGYTVISVFQCNLNKKSSLLFILNLVLIKKKGLNLKYQ